MCKFFVDIKKLVNLIFCHIRTSIGKPSLNGCAQIMKTFAAFARDQLVDYPAEHARMKSAGSKCRGRASLINKTKVTINIVTSLKTRRLDDF